MEQPVMDKKLSMRIDDYTFKQLNKLSEYYAISNSDLIRMLIRKEAVNVLNSVNVLKKLK